MIPSHEEVSMPATQDQTARGDRADEPKKVYSKPQIEDYGTVVELTGTGSGTVEDGGLVAFSGAAG